MSGHSKWATTRRQKAVVDAKKGAIFTKLGNLITIAAREKGGDPAINFSLRIAIEKAKAANMPKDNIERAVKRGTGELSGAEIAEIYYEAIGPANSQFIVKSLTDNRNRSASNIRHIFTKHGGQFGAVGWNFGKKGIIRIANEELKNKNINPEELELELIDAGIDDFIKEEEGITIYTTMDNLQKIREWLETKKISVESAEIEFVAKDSLQVGGEDREKLEKIIEELEDNEDVSDYYANVNI
ncbi:MAG: YebC/PmpR family DNA-binding transcriptional regulator [Patescibacteria group bacterium]|jgi:YebC/PmpR family DNA-binding regulatory protein